MNLTKVSLVGPQLLWRIRCSRSSTKLSEHCPTTSKVKIAFYFKQIYHKYNFKRPKQCAKHTQ